MRIGGVCDMYNMDCLEGMKDIPDGSIDMILCDLPYGTTENAWDVRIPFEPLWAEYKRVTKKNAAIVLFSQMPFGAQLIMSNPKEFRYEWIWEKNIATGFLNANKMPMKAHENILVFYQNLPTYRQQKRYGYTPYVRVGNGNSSNYGKHTCFHSESKDGSRYPNDILSFPVSRGLHTTQKPVVLCEYLIKTYTNPGELVLDNCMGSGTTAVACVNTGRHFIGFEKEKQFFDIAVDRVEQAKVQNLFTGYMT